MPSGRAGLSGAGGRWQSLAATTASSLHTQGLHCFVGSFAETKWPG